MAEQPTPVPFPLSGVDVGDAVAGQRPLTTPEGVNARGFDPKTDRARGASRPGLTRYIDQRLP